jgi:urease accessory protein
MKKTDNLMDSSWQGKLNLSYQNNQGKTQVDLAYCQAPLKIQSPFYPEGESICHSVILHTAGGVVGGDRLLQSINLQPQSQVLITTPAASKIYRSQGEKAHQEIRIKLNKNSYLEYLPQEMIVFNGGLFRQNLYIELDSNASWLGWEIIRFGRSARGEIFAQGEWSSYTEVWQGKKPLWIDRLCLKGSKDLFFSLNGLAGKPVIGTLSWIGKPVTSNLIQETRQLWQPKTDNSEIGVTQLLQGFLCRYRGSSVSEVKNWFIQVWKLLRQTQAKQSVIMPRVWLH